MANEIVKLLVDPFDSPDVGIEYDAFGGGNSWGFAYLGGEQPTWGDCDAAMRFRSIAIPKNTTMNLARLVYDYDTVGSAPTGAWKFRVYGIAEDNAADFESGSNPFGRSRTTAYVEINDSGPPTSGGSKTINVASIVNEIVSRSGWSSGNAIAFVLVDNGSDNDVWAKLDAYNSYFAFRLAAEPNFTPTPKSVAAPTFPSVDSYGMKISYPGYDVLDATEGQLYFTTRKREYKIIAQGKINTTANTVTSLALELSLKVFRVLKGIKFLDLYLVKFKILMQMLLMVKSKLMRLM